MHSRLKESLKVLCGIEKIGREVIVLPSDTFVVSYPKSGNTWTRFLIGNLLNPKEIINFENIEVKIPDIYVNNESDLKKIEIPRTLKSHEYFDPRYKKVILIVRDPRDIAVSYFHHCIKMKIINDNSSLDDFVDKFIEGGFDPFGTWGENVGSWIGARRGCNNFLLLKYEDLLDDTAKYLRKIADFLEIAVNNDDLEMAIEASKLKNMQKMEMQQMTKWKPTKDSRQDKMFVREGKSGGWKNTLSDSAARKIEFAWSDLMCELGYSDV